MKQEAFTMSLLLDYYGSLLTEKQRNAFDLYYNQDLSLAEIAEQEGISRQGVHDTINRTEAALLQMEKEIGCIERAENIRKVMETISGCAETLLHHEDPTVRKNAECILSAVRSIDRKSVV